MFFKVCALSLLLIVFFKEAESHGMMLDPPNRSSMWRFDSTAPVNNDDNQLYCGGMNVRIIICFYIQKIVPRFV